MSASLWRHRSFRKLWAGETISQFGDRVSELALPLIAVLTLAATPTQVGFLTAAVWLPNLFSLLVGAWVDRRPNRKRLLIAADLLRAAVLLSLPIAHWIGVVTLGQLFVVAVLTGAGQVLFPRQPGGDAEAGDPDLAIATHDDVGRLDVLVDDAARVNVAECRRDADGQW
jgi:MFS family permease